MRAEHAEAASMGKAVTASPMDERFLAVARIVRPQGRRGEVSAEILTDFPARYTSVKRAFLELPGAAPDELEIENAWLHKDRIILKFAGVDSIAQANRLRGRYVLIRRDEKVRLGEHRYYLWELEGCQVVAERDGLETVVGTVTAIEPTGGTDLLHVARDTARGGEILIPFAEEICRHVDPPAKRIVIDPPEGLLELNG